MNKYELMLILSSTISDEDRENSLKELKSLLKKNKVKTIKEDNWWEKKLAYKINKSEKWFYILFELEMNWELIKELSKSVNLDRNIWRYIFSRIED